MIDAIGHKVQVITTHRNHFTGDMNTLSGKKGDITGKGNFFQFLADALQEVNTKQNKVSNLTRTMITNPEQVDIHDVMITMEKAKMALNFTRTIRDSVVRAYREITNIR